MLRKLEADARQWVQANWQATIGAITHVEVNPGLAAGCPVMQKFMTGFNNVPAQVQASGFFAWHGTSEVAIPLICNTGFDPKVRAGQAMGPGEYFGGQPSISHGYSQGKGCSRMIVAHILNVPGVTTAGRNTPWAPGAQYVVVNNPVDFQTTFCLPLLVVTYGRAHTPIPFVQVQPRGA